MFQVARVAAVSSAAITFLLATSVAEAHHAGGIGNAQGAGPINTISASTLEQGHSVAGVSVDYTSYDTLSDATLIGATAAGIEDVHGLGTIESYALSFAYGVTDDADAGRAAALHQTDRDPRRRGGDEIEDHGSPSGIGDLTVLGEYRFLNDKASRTEAALLLGVKAPTGATDVHHDGELLEAEFQPGSGAWDGLFGLALTKRVGPWSFDANVLYTLVTEGTQETDLGDLFLYNAAVSYRLTSLGAATPMFHGAHAHEAGDDGHAHTPQPRGGGEPWSGPRPRPGAERRMARQAGDRRRQGRELRRQHDLCLAGPAFVDRAVVRVRLRRHTRRQGSQRHPGGAGLAHLDGRLAGVLTELERGRGARHIRAMPRPPKDPQDKTPRPRASRGKSGKPLAAAVRDGGGDARRARLAPGQRIWRGAASGVRGCISHKGV